MERETQKRLFHPSQSTIASGRKRFLGTAVLVSVLTVSAWAQTFQNGGFELGSSPWNLSGGAEVTSIYDFSRSGSYYLLVGRINQVAHAYQNFEIPSSATAATLSFYYNINSEEGISTAYDNFSATIRNTSGGHLATVGVWSNIDQHQGPGDPYYEKSVPFNLLPYAGQTIRIHFAGANNSTRQTNFRVDDVNVQVTVPPGPSLVFVGSEIFDGIGGAGVGNADGIINPGEAIDLEVDLRNDGSVDATSVRAVLSTSDQYVTITDDDVTFGTIQAGDTDTSSTDFDFDVSSSAPAGHIINFALAIESDQGNVTRNFSLTVAQGGLAPVAVIAGDLTPVTGQTTYYGKYSTGTDLRYSWTTSDGQHSTSRNPQFSFNSPGSYWIYLTVTDSSQRPNSASIPINVQSANNGVTPGVAIGADPVVLSAGNYIQNHIDLQLPGKGFPFEFARFYNSKFSDQTGMPLGYGWTFNYNERLRDTGTNVLVIQGDGSTLTFFPTNSGYVAEPGGFDFLFHTNSDNTWLLTDKRQIVKQFSTNGQLSSITDKNGNTLTLFYTNGILRGIQETAGRSLLFNTNSLGCISDLTDPLGRTIRFEYDANTNLIAVVDANNQTNRYSYDASHQMTDAFDAKGTLYIHNEYSPTNFTVLKQHDALTNWTYFSYDFTNRITYQTNALGKASVYSFDDRLLVTNILDEAINREVFGYDTNRNQTSAQDKNGHQTHYAYDAIGNVTNKLDAASKPTSIQYSAFNNPVSRVDALTNFTTFGYDANGNLTDTTNALSFTNRVQNNAHGLPFILSDARGFNTTNRYDPEGNLVAIIDAKGFTNRFEYDAAGRKIRQIDALSRTNSFFYDNNDNLLYTVNALGFTNAFTYDGNNNRTSSRDPRGAITTNIFDLKDRLVKVIAPLNQTISNCFDALDQKTASYDALQNPTTYGHDDIGNVIVVTNALGQTTRFTFDAQGNQTSLIDPTGHYVTNFFDELNRKFAGIDISLSTNAAAFDALGRVIATTNANGQVTQFFYDAISRLTNVIDAANQSVSFTYDENGNRVRTVDSKNHSWTNVFDELNRLVEQDDSLGHKTIFRYDPVGNLTNKFTANGDSISYSYDALNRVTNIAYPSGPPVTFAYDSVGNRTNMTDSLETTTWEYDLLNRLTSVTDPYGQIVAYGYDANGNRTSLTYPGNKTVHYGFDSLNRLTALTNWLGGIITYSYDNRGNLIAATNANNTIAVYGYDLANRLVTLTNATPDGSLIAGYTLSLDGVGNYRQATLEQPLFPILPNQTNIYTPDSDNRLTTIDGQTVTHNANGDLTGLGSDGYSYDVEDRLTQFALTNAFGTCSYDGLGNRLARTVNGQSRRFVLDRTGTLTQVLMETDASGNPIAYYVYGAGLAQRITPGGQTTTYHFNIQGSAVALTDSAANITDSYAYDSFGVLANFDGDSSQPFRYLGRYGIIDDGTGLYHARARYFSPHLGRFLTKDPITGKDSDSQSLNRYIYALNNPLRFIDPSGLTAREGRALSQFNEYAGEAAYWKTYDEETKWMRPWLTAFKWAGEGAQVVLIFVSGGGSRVAGKALEKVVVKETTAAAETGLTTALRRFFYDNRQFKTISREYWKPNGADGSSLHHWLIPQRAKFVPQGIRNAGFNLMELPPVIKTPFGGLNQWMGMSRSPWAPVADWGLKLGVPTSAGGAGYGGYQIGNTLWDWSSEN